MMTNAETGVVFKDQEGNYFILPQETLEQGRVSQERTSEIDHLIAEQQDAHGHMIHALMVPAAIITVGIVLIARELNQGIEAVGGLLPPASSPESINVPIRWPVR